jgi:hypothetical protein
MTLPTDRDARNAIPLWDGLFSYFPDVWAEIAKVSVLGNKQHNLGAKLFWNREVSTDHLNKVMRHCFDHGTGNVLDTDGTYHMAKAIWRACAELQLAIEARKAKHSPTLLPIVEKLPGWPLTPEERQDLAARKRAESY